MSAGNLNSGPHGCVTGTLPTEHLPSHARDFLDADVLLMMGSLESGMVSFACRRSCTGQPGSGSAMEEQRGISEAQPKFIFEIIINSPGVNPGP